MFPIDVSFSHLFCILPFHFLSIFKVTSFFKIPPMINETLATADVVWPPVLQFSSPGSSLKTDSSPDFQDFLTWSRPLMTRTWTLTALGLGIWRGRLTLVYFIDFVCLMVKGLNNDSIFQQRLTALTSICVEQAWGGATNVHLPLKHFHWMRVTAMWSAVTTAMKKTGTNSNFNRLLSRYTQKH